MLLFGIQRLFDDKPNMQTSEGLAGVKVSTARLTDQQVRSHYTFPFNTSPLSSPVLSSPVLHTPGWTCFNIAMSKFDRTVLDCTETNIYPLSKSFQHHECEFVCQHAEVNIYVSFNTQPMSSLQTQLFISYNNNIICLVGIQFTGILIAPVLLNRHVAMTGCALDFGLIH